MADAGRSPRPPGGRRTPRAAARGPPAARAHGFTDWSTQASSTRCAMAPRACSAAGLPPGDRLAIVAESRPEWLLVDLAAQTVGVVTVPVYPTLRADAGAVHPGRRGLPRRRRVRSRPGAEDPGGPPSAAGAGAGGVDRAGRRAGTRRPGGQRLRPLGLGASVLPLAAILDRGRAISRPTRGLRADPRKPGAPPSVPRISPPSSTRRAPPASPRA